MMILCDVRDLRWRLAGLTLKQAATVCGVSVRSIQRWQKAGACPLWFHALCLALAGDLGRYDPRWSGWRVVGPRLQSPEGDLFTPDQLRGLRWVYGEAQALRAQVRDLMAPGVQMPLFNQQLRIESQKI